MRILFFSAFLYLTIVPSISLAKTKVVLGPVYRIDEPDMLTWIEQRMERMQASGELQQLQESQKKRALKTIHRPAAVASITHTKKNRKFRVDPSVVIEHAIQDHQGRIIAMPGTRINPFSYIQMSKHLVFIDGDSKEQRRWALAVRKHYHDKVKIILTSGSPIEMMEKSKVRVFFDQQGRLSKKFHIQHVPSIVSQDGMNLLISEVLPGKIS